MFFLELSILVLLIAISNEQVHYVTNSELLIQNDTCYINGEEFYPCATLELLSIKFSSTPPETSFKMSIYFLHENYIVKEPINFSFTALPMIELRPWKNQSQIGINCTSELSFTCTDVSKIAINSLAFHHCGMSQPVILLNSIHKNTSFQEVTISDSLFFKSRVKIVCHQSNMQIINSMFEENTEHYGLEIISSHFIDGNFTNTSFSNNQRGSLHISTTVKMGFLRFEGSKFLNNTSGVLVKSLQAVSINNCVFVNNTEGGAISIGHDYPESNHSILLVNHSKFINNAARKGGAIQIADHINFQMYNSKFIGNIATSYGGAIIINIADRNQEQFSAGTESFIINCYFYNNSAGSGGALFISFTTNPNNAVRKSRLVVRNTSFTLNTAKIKGVLVSNSGGALSIQLYGSVVFEAANFLENYAADRGGAISSANTAILISKCTFQYNFARFGSALNANNIIILKVSDCIFVENNATQGSPLEAEFIFGTQSSISSTIFKSNHAKNGGAMSLRITYSSLVINKCIFLYNTASFGGALAVLTSPTNPNSYPLVLLTDCNFTANSAVKGGAVASNGNCNLQFTESKFLSNHAEIEGGAIYINEIIHKFSSYDILFSRCNFFQNSALSGGAIADLGLSAVAHLNISECSFIDNTAKRNITFARLHKYFMRDCNALESTSQSHGGKGGALSLETSHIVHITQSSFKFNEADYGGAAFLQLSDSIINHCIYVNNWACIGGALYLKKSNLTVQNLMIRNNTASSYGGGIYSLSSSLKFLDIFKFHNNSVQLSTGKGGAIYVMDSNEECKINSCPILWSNNATFDFVNNSASKGPILYGGMLDRCHDLPENINTGITAHIHGQRSHRITSKAVKYCYCKDRSPICGLREINKDAFPGQNIVVFVMCTDQLELPVACNVKNEYNQKQLELGQGENSRVVHECEALSFHVFSTEEQFMGTLNMSGIIVCTDSIWRTLQIHIRLLPCPMGFQITKSQCQCDGRLHEEFGNIDCNITSMSIIINKYGWFSYDGGYLRVHNNCPLNYCSISKDSIPVYSPDRQCANNHGGILCGGCVANYSVGLGSWKCMNCSNLSRYNFIWLTVVIALAGVVLVVFLLLVKMTVSNGTINGLVFYANILSFSGLLDYHTCSIHPVLRVFLSWINLDFGIEVCFYSGMDVYQKTWLQFGFPFYIWFLVGVIILFCHYSSTVMKLMGMRNIEVLATLFLLSYAKLLKTIITALSFTDIKIASANNVSDPLVPHRVWVYDGNINYFNYKHLILFTVALLFLLFIFIPYTILLTFGQCLKYLPRKRGLHWIHSTFVTAIMDAYHAPYTRHHCYWTGLGLLVRCCLFTLFGISYNLKDNLFWITLAVLFLLTIRLASTVYQKNIANLFEIIFLVNLAVLALTLSYSSTSCTVLSVSVSVSFVGFVCILGYHIYIKVKVMKCSMFKRYLQKILAIVKSKPLAADENEENDNQPEEYSVSYIELRETLIDN